MREFRITVNGQPYEVSVEEMGSTSPIAAPAAKPPVVAKPPAPTPPVKPSAAAPRPAPAAAPKPVAQSTGGGAGITAPMPGVILNIMVTVGQSVKEGDVLLILEAMKMENEVTSPSAGTVKEIPVSKGSNVNTGDLMIVIE
ncbi:MAG: biotin/lipoyl-binding protein [Clostridiales bacterium]|jgi:glutaconyl-CoA decarboxylase|nr:biotin/lipoyl-binding protein [Clostridiales bacterium]